MKPERRCGDCQLCCKLLPMDDKPAGQRCPQQRHHKGCAVYARRPLCCRLWNCRWLVNDDTADLPRPDRAHYVIDLIPDIVRAIDNSTGETFDLTAIQVWVDRDFPDAHRDPALRAYLARRGERDRAVALIRYGERDGFVLWPPALTGDGQWAEVQNSVYHRNNHFAPPDTWTRPKDEQPHPAISARGPQDA